MSNVSPFRSATDTVTEKLVDIRALAAGPVRFLGFWTAILAPLAYPPLLLGGLDGQTQLLLLAGVFVANVLGLVLGRGYRADA
ncbi:hypothetical protein KTS45_16525 [Halomicroarcula limicola]|uniref:Uncharacterized protein n=1 Tax=Haloarcula limicola TaxID=1429915 RepID=A0A8J8C4N2_9EURY|nr:hypothetical protein [Halomicroarcula limicola]MBV0925811.1 hypothetical protein [Halomicroarcula limicola]